MSKTTNELEPTKKNESPADPKKTVELVDEDQLEDIIGGASGGLRMSAQT